MPTPRLNGLIRALEAGQHAFAAFCPTEMDSAINFATTRYDGLIFEAEHNAWDGRALRDSLQYLLNRRLIAESASIAPAVTPIVRIPPNGAEMNQWFAKQALDLGAYGIIWPHISTVAEAYNAVAACRYPRLRDKPLYEPAGVRGDGPTTAARYWGVNQQEYYRRADVWPLNADGEICVILMIEDTTGIANLRAMLTEVRGIAAVLIGEGDLSQELGVPRQYDHPVVREAMSEVVAVCREMNVVCGHPHVDAQNAKRVIAEGYRFLMCAPSRSYAGLVAAQQLTGRQ